MLATAERALEGRVPAVLGRPRKRSPAEGREGEAGLRSTLLARTPLYTQAVQIDYRGSSIPPRSRATGGTPGSGAADGVPHPPTRPPADCWCGRRESNSHDLAGLRILSPVCLPVPPR